MILSVRIHLFCQLNWLTSVVVYLVPVRPMKTDDEWELVEPDEDIWIKAAPGLSCIALFFGDPPR